MFRFYIPNAEKLRLKEMSLLGMDIWNILGILSIISLIIFYGTRNAVWLIFSFGIIIALITGLTYAIKGDGFNWMLFKKIIIVGTLLGLLVEIAGRLTKKSLGIL